MSLISIDDANAWTDKTKALITSFDTAQLDQLTAEILARISAVYSTTTWTDPTLTPTLIRKVIAMEYVGWYYQKTYSEDESTNSYGLLLIADAEKLLAGIVDQTLIVDAPPTTVVTQLQPGSGDVYPNDVSSASQPTADDRSLGGPAFTMGVIW